MTVPRSPSNSFPTEDANKDAHKDNNAAQLNARERRALLEDIGHVALTLGRFLRPPTVTPETSLTDGLPDVAFIPASPLLRSRPAALTSPQERLHFLCALWTEIESALAAIVRQPDSRAACVPQSMPLARSQGGSGAAASVARSPRTAAAWRQIQAANKQYFTPDFSTPHSPVQTPVPVSFSASPTPPEQTPVVERVTKSVCDTWANRLVVSLLTHIESEAGVLRRLADFCDATQEAAEADRLAKTARRIRMNTFLRDCPGLRDSEQGWERAGDTIGRCSAPYRAVYRAWRSLRHPLDFDWSGSPLLYLPALEPWHLYEIWCYLQVAAALLRAGWCLTDSDLLHCTPNGLRLGLATGRASRLCFEKGKEREKGRGKREEGKETFASTPDAPRTTRNSSLFPFPSSLSLYYQPLFASVNQTARRNKAALASTRASNSSHDGSESGGKWEGDEEFAEGLTFVSRSHAMQPDIALHSGNRVILLDPKFKRYAEAEDAQDDINKMHTYRDAVVRQSKPSGDSGQANEGQANVRQSKGRGVSAMQNTSPVSAAWCLFPGGGANATKENEAEAGFHNSRFASPVYAYPAATLETPFGTAEVGAFSLRPGQPDTTERLAEFLAALLKNMV